MHVRGRRRRARLYRSTATVVAACSVSCCPPVSCLDHPVTTSSFYLPAASPRQRQETYHTITQARHRHRPLYVTSYGMGCSWSKQETPRCHSPLKPWRYLQPTTVSTPAYSRTELHRQNLNSPQLSTMCVNSARIANLFCGLVSARDEPIPYIGTPSVVVNVLVSLNPNLGCTMLVD